MRRIMTALCVVGLIAAGATVASAAIPPANKSFHGSGSNNWNQGGSWSRHGSRSFSLTTSSRQFYAVKKFRMYIKSFRGTYNTSCNGTHRVGASNILIHSNGSFNFGFTSRGAHVRIWGKFTGRGDIAKVNYLVNFSGSGTHPGGLNSSCATWVHGTATEG
jgi:hypothetical protein